MLLDGPTVFVRGGRGWIGEGPTTRGEFAGGGAFREAADWWRATMNARRATGQEGPIVAFAAFPFDAASPAGAILLVPASARAVDDAWIGEQGGSGARRPHAALLPGAMTRGDYQAAVAATSAAIRAGRLEKAVLARDVVAVPDEPVDLDALIARLVAAHPGASVFCVDGLVGASPETLLAVHGGVATARVLAGTAGREEAEALLESDKDRREHALAVRSVVEALAPHVRALQTTEPYVLEQPHLTHLATDVTAEVADGSDVLALVAALHPTAAVAGTPRAAALDLIRATEPVDRGRYAGPVGWFDADGDGEFAIALRCAQLRPDGSFHAFAGAGIMGDSAPEVELAETELKLRPILEALGALR